MTGATPLILKGILLGLGAAVPIGPVNVEIARRTLRQGFRHGVALGAGAVTVDITYAIVASLGWSPLLKNDWIVYPLGLAGVLLLLYLAFTCFRGVWRGSVSPPTPGSEPSGGDPDSLPTRSSRLRACYLTGLLMTFFNPMTLAFWFVVLPGIAARLTDDPRYDLPFLCLGVFLGAFAWVLTFSGALSLLGRFKRGPWIVAADAVGGVVLLGFAIATAFRLIRTP